jgi:outer membrane protein
LSGPYVPPGVNFHTDNLETLYVGYIRTFSTHFSAELALGWPPLTKTEGRGPASLGSVPYSGQVISTARWFAPTAFLEYTFFDRNAPLRPFIGIGVNYTNFYDRTSTAEGNAASGGPTKISLPASWGPAATVGLSYRLADRWHLYASYSASKVNTRLTADTGGVIRTSHIEFNPQALVISVGYAF